MTQELDQEGRFRGQITSYSLFESDKDDSQSVGIRIVVLIDSIFQDGAWHDWSQYQLITSGLINVIKRDGKVNERQVQSLMEHAGWSGRFDAIHENTWKPDPISVTVQKDTYNGDVSYRINWINPYESASSGSSSSESASELDKKFGSIMRVFEKNITRNELKPIGKPVNPPAPPTPSTPDEDIPF